MPQKVCERGIYHVIAYSFFFEMPRNRICSFSVHFLFSESNGKNLDGLVLKKIFNQAPDSGKSLQNLFAELYEQMFFHVCPYR